MTDPLGFLEKILAAFGNVAPLLKDVRVFLAFIYLLYVVSAFSTSNHLYILGLSIFIIFAVTIPTLPLFGSVASGSNNNLDTTITISREALVDAAGDLRMIVDGLDFLDVQPRISILRRVRDLYYFVGREDLAAEVRQLIAELLPPPPG